MGRWERQAEPSCPPGPAFQDSTSSFVLLSSSPHLPPPLRHVLGFTLKVHLLCGGETSEPELGRRNPTAPSRMFSAPGSIWHRTRCHFPPPAALPLPKPQFSHLRNGLLSLSQQFTRAPWNRLSVVLALCSPQLCPRRKCRRQRKVAPKCVSSLLRTLSPCSGDWRESWKECCREREPHRLWHLKNRNRKEKRELDF